ncbi:prepilin-type N-terminal cleavage/methylation domain-containing protein, partial [bacterium]|nr:prepilin-type N-terminal cleavage/methylation domain-containing protein [bacterium]
MASTTREGATILPTSCGEPISNHPVSDPTCPRGHRRTVANGVALVELLACQPKRTRRARRQARSGFTLIELLVVVAILLFLAALLMPALKGARERAKAIYCVNNLREIHTGFALYAAQYNDALPPVGGATYHWSWYIGKGTGCWGPAEEHGGNLQGVYITYGAGRWPVLRCPSELGSQHNYTNWPLSNMNGVTYYDNEMALLSYSMNWTVSMYCYYPGYCPCMDWFNCAIGDYPFRKGFSAGPQACSPAAGMLVMDCQDYGWGWIQS